MVAQLLGFNKVEKHGSGNDFHLVEAKQLESLPYLEFPNFSVTPLSAGQLPCLKVVSQGSEQPWLSNYSQNQTRPCVILQHRSAGGMCLRHCEQP